MAAGLKLGKDGYLYRNTGTWGSPTWNQIPNVRDLTLNLEYDKGDATNRNSSGVKMTEPTLQGRSIEFEMLEDTSDTDFTTLIAAFLARTLVDYWCGSGDKTVAGNTYVRFEGKITSFKKTEPLGDINKYAVVIEPCYSSNAPDAGITS